MINFLAQNIDKIIPLFNLIIIFSLLILNYKYRLIIKKNVNLTFLNNKYFDYFFIVFVFLLVFNFLNNYFSPYFFTDIHENAWINTTIAFSKNINPLKIENASEFANLYSTVWPLIVSKFSFLVDLKISSIKQLMHVINLILFIIFCILITYFIEKKNKANVVLILVTFYLIFTQRNNLGSSSHTIGMFFYIFGIFISYFKKGNLYLFTSLILISIATLFKQYFFLGLIIVIIPNLYKLDKEKIFYLLAWVIISIFIYLFLFINYELYFDIHYNYYLNYSKYLEFTPYRIIFETGYIFKYFPFLIILFYYSLLNFDFGNEYKKKFLITSILVIFFIILKMWTNLGNFGTYSQHLILPIMLIYIVEYINKTNNLKFLRLINIFIVFSILINHHNEFGFISKTKIEKNRNLFIEINKIVEEQNNKEFFLDKGLRLIDEEIDINNYDPGHKLQIENYINSRKNGYLKRSVIEEFFLKKINKNQIDESYKFEEEIFFNEINNFNKFNFAICSICPQSIKGYKIDKIGELYINSLKPLDVKKITKKEIF